MKQQKENRSAGASLFFRLSGISLINTLVVVAGMMLLSFDMFMTVPAVGAAFLIISVTLILLAFIWDMNDTMEMMENAERQQSAANDNIKRQ